MLIIIILRKNEIDNDNNSNNNSNDNNNNIEATRGFRPESPNILETTQEAICARFRLR